MTQKTSIVKTFADQIIEYMEQQDYKIYWNQGEKNIIYVEGADTNRHLPKRNG